MALVTKFNYTTRDYEPVPGTEDFVAVHSEHAGGYDWASFDAYYSPSRRMYFWYTDSGCSCYGPMESVDSVEDFEVGSREPLLSAWKGWAQTSGSYYGDVTTEERARGIAAISTFKEEGPYGGHN